MLNSVAKLYQNSLDLTINTLNWQPWVLVADSLITATSLPSLPGAALQLWLNHSNLILHFDVECRSVGGNTALPGNNKGSGSGYTALMATTRGLATLYSWQQKGRDLAALHSWQQQEIWQHCIHGNNKEIWLHCIHDNTKRSGTTAFMATRDLAAL